MFSGEAGHGRSLAGDNDATQFDCREAVQAQSVATAHQKRDSNKQSGHQKQLLLVKHQSLGARSSVNE